PHTFEVKSRRKDTGPHQQNTTPLALTNDLKIKKYTVINAHLPSSFILPEVKAGGNDINRSPPPALTND
ncbi:hypothetical protein TNCV_1022421, partial [Trichonephila clavipes]